jgi:hypothetical protein
MNEKQEQFEQRLSRQPIRQVPAEWREEILAAAGRESQIESRAAKGLWSSSLVLRLSSVFWPHPVAWAGLAAAWLFILGADLSARDRAPAFGQASSPPPVEVIVEVRQQQQLLVELLGLRDTRDADRSKPLAPQPRSQSVEMLAA